MCLHSFVLRLISQYSNMGTRWIAEELGFDSQHEQGIFTFSIASRLALGPTQPPIQWVLGASLPGEKQQWHEADHSPPSIA
jgi:hypothetical protein